MGARCPAQTLNSPHAAKAPSQKNLEPGPNLKPKRGSPCFFAEQAGPESSPATNGAGRRRKPIGLFFPISYLSLK